MIIFPLQYEVKCLTADQSSEVKSGLECLEFRPIIICGLRAAGHTLEQALGIDWV
jgi:hypothetical protein